MRGARDALRFTVNGQGVAVRAPPLTRLTRVLRELYEPGRLDALRAAAPVKAPFECPNSSASIRGSGIAAALNAMNRWSARALLW